MATRSASATGFSAPSPGERDPRDNEMGDAAMIATVAAVAVDYPTVPEDRIEHLLRERFAQADAAYAPRYRLVLAERDARVALRRDERAKSIPSG